MRSGNEKISFPFIKEIVTREEAIEMARKINAAGYIENSVKLMVGVHETAYVIARLCVNLYMNRRIPLFKLRSFNSAQPSIANHSSKHVQKGENRGGCLLQ